MNTPATAIAITTQPQHAGWWRALLHSTRGSATPDRLEDESTWLGYEAAHPLTWLPGASGPADVAQSE